jgi:hypothetical protein
MVKKRQRVSASAALIDPQSFAGVRGVFCLLFDAYQKVSARHGMSGMVV